MKSDQCERNRMRTHNANRYCPDEIWNHLRRWLPSNRDFRPHPEHERPSVGRPRPWNVWWVSPRTKNSINLRFDGEITQTLTSEISTTTAQFMLRNTCPMNMRIKAHVTDWSKTYRAPNIKGTDMSKPRPQITGSIQAIFFRSHRLRPLPNIRPHIPAALKMIPKMNPTLRKGGTNVYYFSSVCNRMI